MPILRTTCLRSTVGQYPVLQGVTIAIAANRTISAMHERSLCLTATGFASLVELHLHLFALLDHCSRCMIAMTSKSGSCCSCSKCLCVLRQVFQGSHQRGSTAICTDSAARLEDQSKKTQDMHKSQQGGLCVGTGRLWQGKTCACMPPLSAF